MNIKNSLLITFLLLGSYGFAMEDETPTTRINNQLKKALNSRNVPLPILLENQQIEMSNYDTVITHHVANKDDEGYNVNHTIEILKLLKSKDKNYKQNGAFLFASITNNKRKSAIELFKKCGMDTEPPEYQKPLTKNKLNKPQMSNHLDNNNNVPQPNDIPKGKEGKEERDEEHEKNEATKNLLNQVCQRRIRIQAHYKKLNDQDQFIITKNFPFININDIDKNAIINAQRNDNLGFLEWLKWHHRSVSMNSASCNYILYKAIQSKNQDLLEYLVNQRLLDTTSTQPLAIALHVKSKTTIDFLSTHDAPVFKEHFDILESAYKQEDAATTSEMRNLLIKQYKNNDDLLRWSISNNQLPILQELTKNHSISNSTALIETRRQYNELSKNGAPQEKLTHLEELLTFLGEPLTFSQKHPRLLAFAITGTAMSSLLSIVKIFSWYSGIRAIQQIMKMDNSIMNFQSNLSLTELSHLPVQEFVHMRKTDVIKEKEKLAHYLTQAQSRFKKWLCGITNDSIAKAQQGIKRLTILEKYCPETIGAS